MDYRVRPSDIFQENHRKMPNEAVQSLFKDIGNSKASYKIKFPQVIAYRVWMKFLSAAIGVWISVIIGGFSGPKQKHRKNTKQCREKFLHCFCFGSRCLEDSF